ncbi:endonuclease/exonuclease/phosphatase [Auraticoccus sp. F435]|uniref:Endonuclease/exonuclease/phosphatase n=1 Tax=Auraticoccus cholistanensis TaxID=2656650 RepID=A0A6A9UUN7_9ACTN|nr:endonuclease/exonuclease/phosphatase family protein [Auraticoccus cholistanensis]MVA75455.1 endonuclease/exonuclease/phosphatase [Auraticoccus cholistanensis]
MHSTAHRAAVLLTAALTLLLTALPASASPRPGPPPAELQVMAYNIHHGAGVDGVLDLERVARVIEESGADVVGLQEVDRHFGARSEDVDQARWLARRLRMHVTFGANLDLEPAPGSTHRRQYGTAILSRFPILESQNHLLTSIPYPERPTEQRGLLHAAINVRGTTVDVWSTHLDHQRAEQRISQAREIVELTSGTADRPGFLVGDLNATAETTEVRLLAEAGFADPFAGSGPEGWTYPAEAPRSRIDYVLGRGVSSWQDPVVLATTASDHRPVLVTVEVPRPARG